MSKGEKKMVKNVFKDLTKWQNYAHYLVLTILLVVIFHIMGIHKFHTEEFLPSMHFAYLYLTLLIGDTAIYYLFKRKVILQWAK